MNKGKPANTSKKTGMIYERVAADYLVQKGYRILERNFYSSFGEIDLVARDDVYLVFLEVKYRASDKGGHPLEAVDFRKQQRIRRAALLYCLRHCQEEVPCRFDVIGILGKEIFHLEDAF